MNFMYYRLKEKEDFNGEIVYMGVINNRVVLCVLSIFLYDFLMK